MGCREAAIQKISALSKEDVAKVLIFMAGMQAEHMLSEHHETIQTPSLPKRASPP